MLFGHKDARWFRIKWAGYEKEEWEQEHLLVRDGCTDSIRNFWLKTGLNPAQEFYADPDGQHRCSVVCGKSYKRAQDLKAHKTRMKHHEQKQPKRTHTALKGAILEKRKKMQDKLPKVVWQRFTESGELEHELEADNASLFKYLGSVFEAGGGHMTDVRTRIAMARKRFGQLRHLWQDKGLHLNLRLRLYVMCV